MRIQRDIQAVLEEGLAVEDVKGDHMGARFIVQSDLMHTSDIIKCTVNRSIELRQMQTGNSGNSCMDSTYASCSKRDLQ